MSSAWCYRCCSPAALQLRSIDRKLIPSLPWTCLTLRTLPDALGSLLTLFSPTTALGLQLRGVEGSEGCCQVSLPAPHPSFSLIQPSMRFSSGVQPMPPRPWVISPE